MKRKIFLYLSIFLFFLMIGNIYAWGPNTHNYIADRIESNEIKNITPCFDNSVNEQAFRGGIMLPDIAVLDYIINPKNYLTTHSWDFQKKLMNNAESQDEKCLAYGTAVHLIADSIAHEKLIPSKIKETGFPNWITHFLMEEKYDECLAYNNKNLIMETQKSLDIFKGAKKEGYTEKIKNSLKEKTDLNVKRNINQLNFILNSLRIITILNKPSMFSKLSCNETEIEDYMKETEDLIVDNLND